MTAILRRAIFGGIRGNAVTVSVGLCLIRCVVGLALCTVFEKLLPRDGRWGPQDWFIRDVAAMGFPAPAFFAWCAVLSECVGGVLLMLGLLTRIAAPLIAVTTFVAAFRYHEGDIGGSGLLAFLFFVITVGLAISGPGGLSIDRFLAPRAAGRSSPIADPRPAADPAR